MVDVRMRRLMMEVKIKKTDDGWQGKIVIVDKDQQMENGNQDQQLDGRGHGKILVTEDR